MGSMRSPAAHSRRLSPRVTNVTLIIWQSTRHLVADRMYYGKETPVKLVSLSTVHLATKDGRVEWSAFPDPF